MKKSERKTEKGGRDGRGENSISYSSHLVHVSVLTFVRACPNRFSNALRLRYGPL